MAESDVVDVSRLCNRYPYVTGTSVLGITYKDGILLACDTLGEKEGWLAVALLYESR